MAVIMLPSLLLFLQCDSSILTTGRNLNFSKEDRKLTKHQPFSETKGSRTVLTLPTDNST